MGFVEPRRQRAGVVSNRTAGPATSPAEAMARPGFGRRTERAALNSHPTPSRDRSFGWLAGHTPFQFLASQPSAVLGADVAPAVENPGRGDWLLPLTGIPRLRVPCVRSVASARSSATTERLGVCDFRFDPTRPGTAGRVGVGFPPAIFAP